MSSRSRPSPRSAPLELVAPRKQPLSAVLVEIDPVSAEEEGLAPVPLFLAGEEDRGESESHAVSGEAERPGADIVAISPERAKAGKSTAASTGVKSPVSRVGAGKASLPRASTKATASSSRAAKATKAAGAKAAGSKTTASKTAASKTAASKTAASKTAVSTTVASKVVSKQAAEVAVAVAPVVGRKVGPGLPPGTEAEAMSPEEAAAAKKPTGPEVRVRRLHRRDLNRTWEFLKLVFRDVNRETVEYQRPRSKRRFFEVYEEEGEQLLFEVEDQIVGYAECAFDASGVDNWINPRYFEKRGMRPLYVDELAVHPAYQGKGVGGFMLDQLQHLARVRGCTHLVLEVAENNNSALTWYRRRNFFKLDAAIFLAQKVPAEPELLPPRRLPQRRNKDGSPTTGSLPARKATAGTKRTSRTTSSRTSRKR